MLRYGSESEEHQGPFGGSRKGRSSVDVEIDFFNLNEVSTSSEVVVNCTTKCFLAINRF